MHRTLALLAGLLMLTFAPSESHAVSWKTSCGADRGSITKSGSSYVFKTSKNYCTGGIFNQRAELTSSDISVRRKVTHTFSSNVAMKTGSGEPFILFQIHDGRNGCAPPMSLRWQGNGSLSFDSDYTKGKGMAGCVENRELRNAGYRGPSLKRNGTAYDLQVALMFDGNGAFDVAVSIDGKQVLSGKYSPPDDPQFLRSTRFYMKHGVYSRNRWDYELTSKGVKVSQAR
jgi:hypothetical protein